MATIKTQPTDADVGAFLDSIPDARRRTDGHALRALMEEVTGAAPTMWGPSCLYIKRLSDVDEDVLARLIRGAWERSASRPA